MRVIVSSDERVGLVDLILEELRKRGHDVEYVGPEPGQEANWPEVTAIAAERVASGAADEAVVMCWTGTGCTIAANKIPGVRAALSRDAETAKGARIWNHANVLALSLRATSEPVAREILDAWFSTPYSQDEWNIAQVAAIKRLEEKHTQTPS